MPLSGADNLGAKVETLLARAADGVLVQDRSEALASLSELLQRNEQVSAHATVTACLQTLLEYRPLLKSSHL